MHRNRILISRRNFLRASAATAAAALAGPKRSFSDSSSGIGNPNLFWREPEDKAVPPGAVIGGEPSGFIPGHIHYRGGQWREHPLAMSALLHEVRKRTSIKAGPYSKVVGLSSAELFNYPFLYISGRYEFEAPDDNEVDRLRRHLTYGGFLLVDDGLGMLNEGFGRSARILLQRIFPRNALEPLPTDHAMFKSYYLIRSIGGRQAKSQELEGIRLGRFTPVVFCRNDLGGAWAQLPDGRWTQECTPGGEAQRKSAFNLGVNIVLYALTGNYKQDLIHHPIIQRRLNQG